MTIPDWFPAAVLGVLVGVLADMVAGALEAEED
jgi:hypothetical protein